MLLIKGTHGRYIFPVAGILGKNVADFVKFFRSVVGFADDKMIFSGQRILIQTVFSIIMTFQNMSGTDNSIQIAETVESGQIKGSSVSRSGFRLRGFAS